MFRISRCLLQAARVFLGLALACSAAPAAASVDQSSPEGAVRAYYADLSQRHYDDALQLLRSSDGAALPQDFQQRLRMSWEKAFTDGTIQPTQIVFTAKRSLDPGERTVPAGVDAVRLVFNVEGTSGARCFPLPLEHATVSEARIDGQWYIVQEATFPESLIVQCR